MTLRVFFASAAGAMTTNHAIARDIRFRAAISGAGVNRLAGFGNDEWWQDQ